MKIIHEGALVPMMTYGTPVWEEAATKTYNLMKLQSTEVNKHKNGESI